MKILALVEDLRINTSSAGICNSNIIGSLLKANHVVNCIYDYSENDNLSWLQSNNFQSASIHPQTQTILSKLFSKLPKGNAILSYIYGFNTYELNKISSWKKYIKSELNKSNNYDFILVLGAGNSMFNYFAISKIKTKIPYIVNYHDPYPINQFPKPYYQVSKWVGKLKAKHSNIVMQNAYRVCFPSQRLYEWMLQFHPILNNKSFVLPHPNAVFNQLQNIPSDEEVFLDNSKFNLLHVGNLLGPRNPKWLLNAFERFINEDETRKQKTVLNIIGTIATENANIVSYNNLQAININNKRISYKKSIELINQSSVLILLEAVAEDSPFMPGKLADYFISEKPILALTPKKSETTRLLGENYPYITESNNEQKIYETLVLLWNQWNYKNFDTFVISKLKAYTNAKNCNEIIMQQFVNKL